MSIIQVCSLKLPQIPPPSGIANSIMERCRFCYTVTKIKYFQSEWLQASVPGNLSNQHADGNFADEKK